MHYKISLTFVKDVCFSKIGLSDNSSLVNSWVSYRFFHGSFVSSVRHYSWNCWRSKVTCFISKSCSVRTSYIRTWRLHWSSVFSGWDNRKSWRNLTDTLLWRLIIWYYPCSFFNSFRWESFTLELLKFSPQIQVLRMSFDIFFSDKRPLWFMRRF